MSARRRRLRRPLALATLALWAAAQVVHAQPFPTADGPSNPAAVPANQATTPAQSRGLGEILSNPSGWLTDTFNNAVVSVGKEATGHVADFMTWVLESGNIVNNTPPALSYKSEAVTNLWGRMKDVANVGLAVATAWGGINMIVHPHIRAPYHTALELLPRVLAGGIMINFSLDWCGFVIETNNALCQAIGSSIPAWKSILQAPDAGSVLVNLIAMLIYVFMGMLLFGQMLMRLAWVDALLVIAPLALLCWVLPQTHEWARLWFSTFFGTVFVQSVQVLVLQLGADLIAHVPAALPSLGSNPIDQTRLWLLTLMLGVSVLQLTRKIPRVMASVSGGALLSSGAGYSAARQMSNWMKKLPMGRGRS